MKASPTTTSTDGETIPGCRGPSPGAAACWLARRPLPEGEGLPPKERNGHEGAEYDNPSTNQRWVHLPGDSRARIAANDGSDEHDPSLCPRHFSRNDE